MRVQRLGTGVPDVGATAVLGEYAGAGLERDQLRGEPLQRLVESRLLLAQRKEHVAVFVGHGLLYYVLLLEAVKPGRMNKLSRECEFRPCKPEACHNPSRWLSPLRATPPEPRR